MSGDLATMDMAVPSLYTISTTLVQPALDLTRWIRVGFQDRIFLKDASQYVAGRMALIETRP